MRKAPFWALVLLLLLPACSHRATWDNGYHYAGGGRSIANPLED